MLLYEKHQACKVDRSDEQTDISGKHTRNLVGRQHSEHYCKYVGGSNHGYEPHKIEHFGRQLYVVVGYYIKIGNADNEKQ